MTGNAVESDIKNIAETEKSSFSIPLSEEELREMLKNPLYRIITAKDGKEYAGHAVFLLTGNVAEIVSVAVPESKRKQGFGQEIIEKIKSVCKEENISEILLEVRVSNVSATALYKKHGFEKIARRPHFYEKPDEDAFTMKYELEKTK